MFVFVSRKKTGSLITRVTADTGVGDPSAATAEKGARFAQELIVRMSAFLVELAAARVAETGT